MFCVGAGAIDSSFAASYNPAQFLGWEWGRYQGPEKVPRFTASWLDRRPAAHLLPNPDDRRRSLFHGRARHRRISKTLGGRALPSDSLPSAFPLESLKEAARAAWLSRELCPADEGGIVLDGHPIDGSLCSWEEVLGEWSDWSTLLLGNGLSRDVSGNFAYASLFDKATSRAGRGPLTDADRKLFAALSTRNFERVLGALASAIRMAEALGQDAGPYLDRYQSIQRSLGHAVRSVHVRQSEIPEARLRAIAGVLQAQEYVFTTSYDLIVYWAMGAVDYERLCDCFWGEKRSFDPANADPDASRTPVYFLHGALHLVVMGSGVTRKLVNTGLETVLQQFGQPLEGDRRARPLLITEGSARHKLEAIEGNDYLSRGYRELTKCALPTVVFGSELGEQDNHLVEALNQNPRRPVAVSIRRKGKGRREIQSAKAGLRGALHASPLYFFDSATHPLGTATT